MSNTPSSHVVLRIRPSALMFVMLVLILGALLLASNGIDPRSAERARFTDTAVPSVTPGPTVDVFANVKYTTWKSPDGLIQFERPESFVEQPSSSSPFTAQFAPSGRQDVSLAIVAAPTARLNVANITSTTTPEDILKQFFANQPQDLPPVTFQAVQASGLKGSGAHYVSRATDQSSGQSVPREGEVWLLALDPTHIFVIQAETNTGEWPQMGPIFDHALQTLKIDAGGLVKALEATATPAATPAATATAAPAQPAAPGTVPATAATM